MRDVLERIHSRYPDMILKFGGQRDGSRVEYS